VKVLRTHFLAFVPEASELIITCIHGDKHRAPFWEHAITKYTFNDCSSSLHKLHSNIVIIAAVIAQ
jgi:hypothetical protein